MRATVAPWAGLPGSGTSVTAGMRPDAAPAPDVAPPPTGVPRLLLAYRITHSIVFILEAFLILAPILNFIRSSP